MNRAFWLFTRENPLMPITLHQIEHMRTLLKHVLQQTGNIQFCTMGVTPQISLDWFCRLNSSIPFEKENDALTNVGTVVSHTL
jgi:hypothetical protein